MIVIFYIITITLTTLFVYVKWQSSYWSRRNVDGPTPVPFFGNLYRFFAGQKHFGEIYNEIYRAYPNASFVGFYNFGAPAILVRDPNLIKAVLHESFSCFQDNYFALENHFDPFLGQNLIFAKGNKWKTLRGQMTPVFTAAKIKTVMPMIQDAVEQCVNYIECGIESDDEFEAKDLFTKYTLQVIATCGFGIRDSIFEAKNNSQFFKYWLDIFDTTGKVLPQNLMITFLPRLNRFLKVPFLDPRHFQGISSIVRDIIKARDENGEKELDFLQAVLDARKKWNFDETTTIGHIYSFMINGFDTTNGSLAFVLYSLAKYQDVQKKAQKEIDEILRSHNGVINDNVLNSLNYLEQVIYESLRMYAPGVAVTRACTKEYRLPPQYEGQSETITIPVGMPVVISKSSVHMDENYYPNPHRFDPQRFSESEIAKRPKWLYLGFGDGPRTCIGTRLALVMLKMVLISLLINFDMETSSKTSLPLKPLPQSFFMQFKGGLWVKFKKRSVHNE